MATRVNVNGRMALATEPTIAAVDRGFLFGLSAYESVRTYSGHPFLLSKHLDRLRASAEALEIPVPLPDGRLASEIQKTLKEAGNEESSIRILVSAGIDDPVENAADEPTVVIIVKTLVTPPPEAYATGVRVALVDVVRNHPDSVSPQIKSSNLINNLMAMRQAKRKGAYEAIMLNHRGEVCEASTSNVFMVRDGTIHTPPISSGILSGVTRELTIEVARSLDVRLEERTILPAELAGADEVFLTASSKEVLPVSAIDDHPVGDDDARPGPITVSLLDAYRRRAKEISAQEATNP